MLWCFCVNIYLYNWSQDSQDEKTTYVAISCRQQTCIFGKKSGNFSRKQIYVNWTALNLPRACTSFYFTLILYGVFGVNCKKQLNNLAICVIKWFIYNLAKSFAATYLRTTWNVRKLPFVTQICIDKNSQFLWYLSLQDASILSLV